MVEYTATVICVGSGKDESEALDNLAFDLHELHRRIMIGEEPMEIKIVESEQENTDPCESCKKCGKTTCGNDTENHACYEKL